MSRLLRGATATISVTVTSAGEPHAADQAPTVVVTRENGESLLTGSSSEVPGETGVYQMALQSALTSAVDVLKAVWSAKVGGVTQTFITHHEIVGDFLVSLTALRASLPTTVAKTDPELAEARESAEDWLEDTCGVAFRTRYCREFADGGGAGDIMLSNPRPTRIRSVRLGSVTGASLEAITGEDLEGIQLYPTGRLFRLSGWWAGRRNVEVTYEHGYESVPAPVARAATRLARWFLVEDPSNYDERATSITTDEAHYSLITPGVGGAVTPIPEVNSVIDRYRFVSYA